MITADELPKVEGNVCYFIAKQPTEAQERRWVADDLLSLTHSPVPVRFLNSFGGALDIALGC